MAAPRTTRARTVVASTAPHPVAGPSKPRAATTKAKTITKKAVVSDVDDLVQAMDRVLKIAEPEPQPNTKDNKAVVRPTKTAAPIRKVPSTITVVPTKTAVKRPVAGASKTQVTPSSGDPGVNHIASISENPAVSTAADRPTKPKAKPATTKSAVGAIDPRLPKPSTLPPIEESHPWASPTIAKEMTPPNLARSAMASLNSCMRSLNAASTEGYRSGYKVAEGAEWTAEKVERELEVFGMALAILRDLVEEGVVKSKAGEVEKAGTALAVRLVGLGMYKKGMEQLVTSRPRILHLYSHVPLAEPMTKVEGKKAVTKMPTPRTMPGKPKSETKSALPSKWYDLMYFPAAFDESELDLIVKTILFQATIAAWLNLLALDGQLDVSLFHLPDDVDNTRINPLVLALELPLLTTQFPLNQLFRRLKAWPQQTLHTKQLALSCLMLTVSTTENSKITPEILWEHVHQSMTGEVGKAEGDLEQLRKILSVVARLIDWVERVMRSRSAVGDDSGSWFIGKAWMEFTDLWMGIARKVGDLRAIDKAVSLMMDKTAKSISPPPRPNTPPSFKISSQMMSTPNTSQSSRRSTKGKHKATQAEVEIMKLCGDLAKVHVVLDGLKTPVDGDLSCQAAESALRGFSLVDLGDAILCLTGDGSPSLEKVVRALERIRRICRKKVDKASALEDNDKDEFLESGLGLAMRQWLIGYVEMAEDILAEPPMDLGDITYELVGACVDSLMSLARLPQTSMTTQTSLAHLDRAKQLCESVRSLTDEEQQASWEHCLSVAAYTVGSKHWREGNHEEAIGYAERSCRWMGSAEKIENYPRRYDFYAACLIKMGEKVEGARYIIRSICAYETTIYEGLSRALSSKPLDEAFEGYPLIAQTLPRLVNRFVVDPAIMKDVALSLGDVMRVCGLGDKGAMGGILEMILKLMEDEEWRKEVAELILGLGRVVLGVYDALNYPVRRLRLITRLMNVICVSGVGAGDFEVLAEEAKQLALVDVSGTADEKLQPFQAEHYATTQLLIASHAYHLNVSPSASILDLSHTAMAELRKLVLPSISPPNPAVVDAKKRPLGRSATVKAPAPAARTVNGRIVSEPKRKGVVAGKSVKLDDKVATKARSSLGVLMVFDNLKRVTTLLGSLASLLGMLGHALAKVEALKLLRALLRGRDDLADAYVLRSAELASEYHKLGKRTRASFVFAQVLKSISDGLGPVSPASQVLLHLRYSAFLAGTVSVDKARNEFEVAGRLAKEIPPNTVIGSGTRKCLDRHAELERVALANSALAAIYSAQDNAARALDCLGSAFRLWSRAAQIICRLSNDNTTSTSTEAKSGEENDDPFVIPNKPKVAGQDETPKTDDAGSDVETSNFHGKHVYGMAWHTAECLIMIALELASANAHRGTVRECEYDLSQAGLVANAVKSNILEARVNTRLAQLRFRLRKYDESAQKLDEAATGLNGVEGPDAVEIKRVQGELLSRREMAEEAAQTFDLASKNIIALEGVFAASEALVPSPRKAVVEGGSSTGKGKEPLLSRSLAQVLRQQAWLFREAGMAEECGQLLAQIKALSASNDNDADDLFLDGRIEMKEAFDHFKTDLWMSSLTESTLAMPMGNRVMQQRDRQSTRMNIQSILDRSEEAFLNLLQTASGRARVEDVRVACQSLALLRAFKTSLGQGSEGITASAAAVLASSASITMQRELLEAIEWKLRDEDEQIVEDTVWPTMMPDRGSVSAARPIKPHRASPNHVNGAVSISTTDSTDRSSTYRSYWTSLQSKYSSPTLFTHDDLNLSVLPHNWAVITVNVTEDRTTMFISRHQRDHPPLVFCLPLDRQGRREGDSEEDLFTFDAARAELHDIINTSNKAAKDARNVHTIEGKQAWWAVRQALDKRMAELLANMEFVWLGAFKTILSPRGLNSAAALNTFRTKLEKTFFAAISPNHAHDSKKTGKVHLDDALVECFAALSSKCKDEEAEDLVYFILDIFQFYGVQVALAELDIDQIAIDVKTLLAELENSRKSPEDSAPEHILLALDNNAQPFPWESIPILRGRPVSRIPSLSFLLDQVALPSRIGSSITAGAGQKIDARRVFYILNPSGDLVRTQAHFQPLLEKTGWTGITGREPTELEILAALRNYDLVIYIGHGGAEQYIRSFKIRHLPHCASVMLWGCSSANLRDQGDFDRAGTAWNYMIAGSPSMIGNLWDVTDVDIDRLSGEVIKKLHLDDQHGQGKGRPGLLPISSLSNVEALATSRDACKLKYLTGAAPVVYGMPMYVH